MNLSNPRVAALNRAFRQNLGLDPIYPPVLTKRDFVRRFVSGEFGNKGPNWNTLEEMYCCNDYRGLVHIRNRVPNAPTWYNVPYNEVGDRLDQILKAYRQGSAAHGPIRERDLYFAGMAPTSQTLIQGEVQRSPHGLYLYYSTVAKPMRDSLREGGREARGIIALSLLRHYLCPNSLDWLYILLDRYPGHVIEFSTYGCNWGTIPGYNTVFWEVRNY